MVARRCQWGASLSSLQCVPTHSAGACTAMLGHKSRLAGPALIMTEMAPRPTPEHHDSTHSSAVPLANTAPVHRYADCSEPMKHYECRSLPIADLVLALHSCCSPQSHRAHARACAHARALGSVYHSIDLRGCRRRWPCSALATRPTALPAAPARSTRVALCLDSSENGRSVRPRSLAHNVQRASCNNMQQRSAPGEERSLFSASLLAHARALIGAHALIDMQRHDQRACTSERATIGGSLRVL
jgi:hypothetical protein